MLNPMMMNVIMRTIPKTSRNEFEDNIIKLKPKSEYRNDVFSNVIGFLFSALCFFVFTVVPYIGFFCFVGGALGMIYSFFAFIRNLLIYKNYEDIFTEADRRKLGEKID